MMLGAVAVIALSQIAVVSEASARGGGSNFMNSPGYQRRLQESRGYVTNRSGSILPQSTVVAPPAYRERRIRRSR